MNTPKFRRLGASQRRPKPIVVACHLTVALCATGSVQAQETQSLETVVITGIRKSMETTPIPGTSRPEHLPALTAAPRLSLDDATRNRLGDLINRSTVSGERYNAATRAEIDTEEF